MKKNILTIFLASTIGLCTIIPLAGCSQSNLSESDNVSIEQNGDKENESSEKKSNLVKPSYTSLNYSNLVDEETQNEVKQILEKSGIKAEYVNNYFDLIKDYNKLYASDLENTSGFSTTNKSQVPYDEGELSNKWMESKKYLDSNCRVSSFMLFRDFVVSDGSKFDEDMYNIAQDLAVIDENSLVNNTNFTDSNIEAFEKIFSIINIDKFGSDEEVAEIIKNTWEKRGVKFSEDKDVTLISGFMKNEDTKDTFIGHAGISIKNGNEILFIEKYSPAMPFQVTKFKNKEEVRSYMYDRLTTTIGEGTGTGPDILVMENDILMNEDRM